MFVLPASFLGASFGDIPVVTKSKFVLPTAWQVNKSRGELLGQGRATLFGNQQTRRTVDSCPKEPSCLRWNSGFFYTERGERKGEHLFPGSGQLPGGCVPSSFLQSFTGEPGQAAHHLRRRVPRDGPGRLITCTPCRGSTES